MDSTHMFLIAMGAFSILVAIIGFWLITRRQEKDEAIDAAIFLAQRQLEEYLKQNK
ncbi:MAG: hypothetical protein HY725_08790 [Candidatus Rokubacteria bacterium]|nr:hypothetical protein [Candidatus Rokubacteria bacterium]